MGRGEKCTVTIGSGKHVKARSGARLGPSLDGVYDTVIEICCPCTNSRTNLKCDLRGSEGSEASSSVFFGSSNRPRKG